MEKLKKDSLSELVYKQIAKMILNQDLAPGEKINRKEIADQLGVSQTPVNEAIIKFTNEGIVEQKERQGFYIKVFTDEDMKELFAVRAGLEGVSLRLCMEKMDPQALEEIIHAFDNFSLPLSEEEHKRYRKADRLFHEKILFSSGNDIIIDFIKNFDFLMKCYQQGLLRGPDETLTEHQNIIKAIKENNLEKAQKLLMDHHLDTRNSITKKHIKTH